MISFDEFKKLELKAGKVVSAERIENSEKLLKLKVDLGSEERQIIAGIGRKYAPEDIIGKEIIVAANLEPKTLMGYESQGMLLAADTQEGPVLLQPEKEVAPGTKIH